MRKLSLWLLIFLLPTQLGAHFWPDFSFVSGFRIDYLSPTIYLIDLLIVAHLLFSIKKLKIKLSKPLLLLIILILINTFFANQPLLTLFFWGKLILYLLLFLSLSKIRKLKHLLYTPLLASTLVVILIQTSQLLLQKSIGGPLYFLGERTFSIYTSNIAKLNLSSLGVLLRPYSTFSHPNSLAGFLLLSLVILNSYSQKKYTKQIKIIISLAIILTFSKIAILALLLLQVKNLKTIKKIIPPAIFAGLLPLLVNFTNLKYIPGDSFLTRAFMGYPTLEIIKQNFLTGTGLKGFIPALANFTNPAHLSLSSLQPVHSLSLLALSELGVLGIILLIAITRKLKLNNPLLTSTILVVALTGAFDHYWWTLPQNQLILILALVLGLKNTHKLNDSNKKNK